VKVRIKNTPEQRELDGIQLDRFQPGSTYEVSSSIASWLVAEGYALPEMRREEDVDTRAASYDGCERRTKAKPHVSTTPQRNPFFRRS
jgi:hypothetical protein